jgi:hypothetical protein
MLRRYASSMNQPVGELDMKGFVAEADRTQTTLLPQNLDDYIDEANAVRAIDAFVPQFDLA